jgi:hypothetical protein
MMKTIYSQNLISAPIEDAEIFMQDLQKAVQGYQDKGLQVDIQFTTTVSRFSALVLAYKE